MRGKLSLWAHLLLRYGMHLSVIQAEIVVLMRQFLKTNIDIHLTTKYVDVFQIDCDVARLMDEKELSRYIPRYGDRVYAKNWMELNREEHNKEDRKQKLINRLREKMSLPAISNQKKNYGHGNKNAESKSRKIELGWMHYQSCSYKQVRRPKGGGTREIVVKKEDTVSHVLDIGIKLFSNFFQLVSTKGNADDFNFMLCVSGSEEPLEENQTIGSLYEATRYKILRLYVCTKVRDQHCEPNQTKENDLSIKRPRFTSTPDITPSTSGCSNNDRSQTLHSHLPTSVNSDETLLSSDDEVVFLGNNANSSFDMVSDTLVYSPVHFDYVVTDTFVETVQNESGSAFIPENTHVEEIPVTEDLPQATDSQEPTNNETFFENPINVIESETVIVRRVHCVNDMIQAFSDKNILNAK
ncbi:hypothetical protein E1301_Tti019684 [Triplophysa tibetana]|uniref:Uncharacterized protein n=1 Tax=Triplophysa tibetana TaxID=1572043 RepID=A0A5A9PDP6_9TELE|nr:hypothetical protein E1301_Tti019684 [Triplophysa tibetana]